MVYIWPNGQKEYQVRLRCKQYNKTYSNTRPLVNEGLIVEGSNKQIKYAKGIKSVVLERLKKDSLTESYKNDIIRWFKYEWRAKVIIDMFIGMNKSYEPKKWYKEINKGW